MIVRNKNHRGVNKMGERKAKSIENQDIACIYKGLSFYLISCK